ncbi:MAG: NAD-dependent epimerase/dehydratase family protein [Amaricoccus sp.]
MAKVVVIGATGHIGSFLVPRLVEAGHAVVAVSRGRRAPYVGSKLWDRVERADLDRDALEATEGFGPAIRALEPDIVVDMTCFRPESARQLAAALDGRIDHYISIGTIWTHGHSTAVPTREDAPKRPFGAYGIDKAATEVLLLQLARRAGFPATILHPGHIVGPGWIPLNPAGNFNPAVFATLARGERLVLPNFGLETVHHVHADDIARLVMAAIGNWRASTGEAFHAVSPAALSLRGFAEGMAAWFGKPADLAFLPFEEWAKSQTEADRTATWEHIARSPNCSMDKARRLLGYEPRHGSLEAVQEAVAALLASGELRP